MDPIVEGFDQNLSIWRCLHSSIGWQIIPMKAAINKLSIITKQGRELRYKFF